MAEVMDVIRDLAIAGHDLLRFAHHTQKWRRLFDRLLDIRESCEAAELTLESWQQKYDIQARHPITYMQVLFGNKGCEHIKATLRSIAVITRMIELNVLALLHCTIKVRVIGQYTDEPKGPISDELLKDCIRRIQRNEAWSRRFSLNVLDKSYKLEEHIERLYRKLNLLERRTGFYLEKQHPDIFSNIQRPAGRQMASNGGDRMDAVQNKILDALATRKDAELLHRAAGYGTPVHLGLSVPQIHRRDFAFLLNLDGESHEVIAHPVRIKAVSDPSRVQRDFSTAVPALMSNVYDACYMLPSSSSSAGFQVSIPPTNLLSDLEHKDSLSNTFRDQNTSLSSQILYPHDQSALATGIAHGCFRLIGTPWADFLDCANIRWRRTKEGKWTSMLTASRGNRATTSTLEQCLTANHNLAKHIHIFRIGLVLAELVLKAPVISHLYYDTTTRTTKLFVNDGEEVDAMEIASEVERQSNILLGNIVFFCLNVLQDEEVMQDRNIEGSFLEYVWRDTEQLERIVKSPL